MILTVEKGNFAYNKDRKILRNIDFSASPGDLIAILGPNGAGKTTLLRCVMGFLRWDSGRSCLDGENIAGMPQRQLWRRIAYVPQARHALTIYTVEEMVLLGRGSHFGMLAQPGRKDLEIARSVMERLGIAPLAKKKCSELSGGELQMVLIAKALAGEAEILILDEPESNLDFRNQLLILETMSALAEEGMTCIFNTHYPAHALQRANKSLLLSKDGSYVFGSTAEVVTEENIRRSFGVNAIIGQIETDTNVLRNVIPINILEDDNEGRETDSENRIAVIAIISGDFAIGDRINGILHDYGDYIIGRMGMPYDKGRVFIINVTVDAPRSKVEEIVGKLSVLPGVSVKATFNKQVR